MGKLKFWKKDNSKDIKDNSKECEGKEKVMDISYKNKKLTGSTIKVKIHRFINGTPIETEIFDGELRRDDNNNTVIFNDAMNFKEEMPGVQDTLVSDIICKLKSRSLSKKEQLIQIDKIIKQQEKIIGDEKDGFITKKTKADNGKDEKVKINRQTEMSKLRIYKCTKYALENKEGEGCFESVDKDGNRTLNYILIDGELIPYWFKTPTNKGEPVILVPDVVGRKKFFKEAETEAIQDFNENIDWYWKGWLGVAMKALTVVFLAGLIVWTIFLAGWSADLHDDSLEPKIQALELKNQIIAQRCNEQLAKQMENNGIIFDYAKLKMSEDLSSPTNKIIDKSNIKI